ncbi:hypothetical protein KY343_04145 [Candidatus Woesearchaeota archaeon]|nr:hypothetical protein [Candidatus Woesearchaeota archaeon]
MQRITRPEMYDSKTAAEMPLSDVVKQAELCASYDAATVVEEDGFTGRAATRVYDIAERFYTLKHLIDTFGKDNPKLDEAVEIIDGKIVSYKLSEMPIKIEIKGGKQPYDPKDRPITGRLPGGQVGAIA